MFKSTARATALFFGLILFHELSTYADEVAIDVMDEQPAILKTGYDVISPIQDKDEEPSNDDDSTPPPPSKPED